MSHSIADCTLAATNPLGFEVFDAVFDPSELAAATTELEEATGRSGKAGLRHVLSLPAVFELAIHSRLLNLAATFIGPGAIPFKATLFDKSRSADWFVAWHQDTTLPVESRSDSPGWGTWSIKKNVLYAQAPGAALRKVVALRLHLDDSHSENGPLRVLPGTHRLGKLNDEEIRQFASQISAVNCLTSTGGVVAMSPLLLHASSKSRSGERRRVLHFEYASSLHVDASVRLACCHPDIERGQSLNARFQK